MSNDCLPRSVSEDCQRLRGGHSPRHPQHVHAHTPAACHRRLALPAEPLITAVTLAELSSGPLVVDDARERVACQAHLQQAEADFQPLPFDAPAARAFG